MWKKRPPKIIFYLQFVRIFLWKKKKEYFSGNKSAFMDTSIET